MPSRTGAADLPLHGYRAPLGLSERMAALAPERERRPDAAARAGGAPTARRTT